MTREHRVSLSLCLATLCSTGIASWCGLAPWLCAKVGCPASTSSLAGEASWLCTVTLQHAVEAPPILLPCLFFNCISESRTTLHGFITSMAVSLTMEAVASKFWPGLSQVLILGQPLQTHPIQDPCTTAAGLAEPSHSI